MESEKRLAFSRWMMQSRRDLKAAEALLAAGSFEWAVFLAHQVAERALKGYLYNRGEKNIVGHAIRALVHKCRNHSSVFEVAHDVGKLDEFYAGPRFPDFFTAEVPADTVTPEDAEISVQLARVAVELVDKVSAEAP
jgi:HEPN domain-containing protein